MTPTLDRPDARRSGKIWRAEKHRLYCQKGSCDILVSSARPRSQRIIFCDQTFFGHLRCKYIEPAAGTMATVGENFWPNVKEVSKEILICDLAWTIKSHTGNTSLVCVQSGSDPEVYKGRMWPWGRWSRLPCKGVWESLPKEPETVIETWNSVL